MKSHAALAAVFLKDAERARWHDQALWFVREKRDRLARAVPGWEELRDTAPRPSSATPWPTCPPTSKNSRENAAGRGAVVHYAADAGEHNRIVLDILACEGRAAPGQEQVDAHRGVRPQRVPRGERRGGRRNRPGRADHPVRQGAAEPHRHAGHPQKERGGRARYSTGTWARRRASPTRRRWPGPPARISGKSSWPPRRDCRA